MITHRTGESAALVAKELRFKQLFTDGSTVQRSERLAVAPAFQVQGMSNQFLAGSRLTGNNHGRIRCSIQANLAKHLAHGGTGPDQPVKIFHVRGITG